MHNCTHAHKCHSVLVCLGAHMYICIICLESVTEYRNPQKLGPVVRGFLCIYTYMYVYIHTDIRVCIYAHVRIHVYMYM